MIWKSEKWFICEGYLTEQNVKKASQTCVCHRTYQNLIKKSHKLLCWGREGVELFTFSFGLVLLLSEILPTAALIAQFVL